MALRELNELGLILPREHWGRVPHASARTGILTALAALLGMASALLIWFGGGRGWTFVGVALFVVALMAFLIVTFLAVEDRMKRLEAIGAEGPGGPPDPQL